MFTHTSWEDKFQFYQMADEQGNSFCVVPSRGGIITELVLSHQPVFYLDRETLFDTTKNIRGGNPVLFPICGPLKNNRYEVQGHIYEMKQHGFARNHAWQVDEIEEGAAGGKITLSLNSNAATQKEYPFAFRLKFCYELTPAGLTIHQTYCNFSKQSMPFYAGFHPYFLTENKDAVSLVLPAEEYFDLIAKKSIARELAGNISNHQEFNVVCSQLTGQQTILEDRFLKRKIIIEYAEPFSNIVLWTLPEKPFVCVEPWMGTNYSMNTGENVKMLMPGEKMQTWVKYRSELLS